MSADWISAGVGLLSGIFGMGRPSTPGYVEENYRLQSEAIRKAMALYDSTNFEQLDSQAVALLSEAAMQKAMGFLSNYDAKAAAAGSPLYKSDTQKARSRTQIAADAALPTAQLATQLLTTRPQRQAALLPNPSQMGAAMDTAQYLDNAALADYQNRMGNILQSATALAKMYDLQRGKQQ